MLKGLALPDGWEVLSAIDRDPNSTGGNFSHGYIVQNQAGAKAFLKALDFAEALNAPDPAFALQYLTEAFNFERQVMRRCSERKLDRVVLAITDGMIRVPGCSIAGGIVQYLIFELADGDLRSTANAAAHFETAWLLRALHHMATGLTQLHGQQIAHQDLKPSNVLVFDSKIAKIGDLGRAALKGSFPPHEDEEVAGDKTYAPPELLYHYVDPDWNRRRLGCDAYLLGSMVVFCFLGTAMTPLVHAQLHPGHHWSSWSGTYDEVLPYVRDAFDKAVAAFEAAVAGEMRERLTAIVRELCEPDPRLRGHPRERWNISTQYSLVRYRETFDLLASRAESAFVRPTP
jgi:serine/threonine protein kinase